MAHTTSTASRRQATIVIIGCAVLFVAFGIMVYSRFCTSIGMAGLYNRSTIGVSFVLFGIAMALFTPCVYLQRMHRKHVDSSQLGREMLGIVLGFLCYVVPFFLAMGHWPPQTARGRSASRSPSPLAPFPSSTGATANSTPSATSTPVQPHSSRFAAFLPSSRLWEARIPAARLSTT